LVITPDYIASLGIQVWVLRHYIEKGEKKSTYDKLIQEIENLSNTKNKETE